MAVSVTDSNNRLTSAESVTNWASDGGGGAGPQLEPDLGYQLTSGSNYAISRKVGTTKGGHAYTHPSTTDMTTAADRVVMLKGVWYNSINSAVYPACGFKVGNDGSNYREYGVISSDMPDMVPDPKRLVYIVPVDPTETAWADIIVGSPSNTAIDFFSIQGDFGGSAKAENVACDAIDLCSSDGVLWLTGGTPDGTFDDFVAHDEGTLTNRFGHISTLRDGVFEVYGKLWIGRTATPTATATTFTDSAKSLLFGKGFFAAGWTGIGVDLGASSDINFSDIVFSGLGQKEVVVYFDTISEINTTTDYITLSPDPGWDVGTPIVYSNAGGSDSIGLTSGNTYWVEPTGTAGQYYVHSSRNNARLGATPVALSTGSTGEAHKVTSTPDIRPDLIVTGTTGTFDSAGCTYNRFRQVVLTSASVFTNDIFRSCKLIDLTTNNGGSLQGCTMTGQTTEPGQALVKTNTPVNIDNCSFTLATGETGSAIEVDTAGSYTLDGNELVGYWASPNNETGATFHSQTGVEPTTDVITTDGNHGFSTGDEVWYNDNGGTDTIGITDGNRYYVNVLSTTTFSLHRSKNNAVGDTNRIALSDGSGGETHTFYSGKAAIVNSSGGSVTLTIGGGGTTPSVRNVGTSTTTIVLNPVTTLVRIRRPDGVVYQGAQVILEAEDGTGDLPYNVTVTITRSGSTATVSHTAHGMGNGDKVVIRKAEQPEYNGVHTISNVSANSYDYTVSGTPATPATGTIKATGVVLAGTTDVNGEISASQSWSVDQNVRGFARKSTATPFYKTIEMSGTIDTADGLTIDRRFTSDET